MLLGLVMTASSKSARVLNHTCRIFDQEFKLGPWIDAMRLFVQDDGFEAVDKEDFTQSIETFKSIFAHGFNVVLSESQNDRSAPWLFLMVALNWTRG